MDNPRFVIGEIEQVKHEGLPEIPGTPSFMDIVNFRPETRRWYAKMRELRHQPPDQLKTQFISQFIDRYGNKRGSFLGKNTETLLKAAEFSLTTLDHVDPKIGIPTFAFPTLKAYKELSAAAGWKVAQGRCAPLIMEQGVKHISAIIYCKEQNPGWMPPEQICQHEAMHELDVRGPYRIVADHEVLQEMIAVIGEVTGGVQEDFSVKVGSHIWMHYLNQISIITDGLKKAFHLDPNQEYSKQQLAEACSETVKRITTVANNSSIVKTLMNCNDFDDVYDKFSKAFPLMYS